MSAMVRDRAARSLLRASCALLLALTPVVASPAPAGASTMSVDSNLDAVDASPGNGTCATAGGVCTLRAAIMEANAHTGHDVIVFNGVGSVVPTSELPALTDSSGVTIRGYGMVTLAGGSAGAARALIVQSGGNLIQGLTVTSYSGKSAGEDCAICVTGSGNVVGTDGDGVDDAEEGCVVVASPAYAIYLTGSNNVVAGNYVGVLTDGTASANNYGVVIYGAGNLVGTDGDGVSDTLERNVISGNMLHGVWVGGSGATGNRIAGNYIGVTPGGATARGNGGYGVYVSLGDGQTIGTNGDGHGDAAERNVISGHSAASYGIGVRLDTANNVVAGNYIGLNALGSAVIANYYHGVQINDSSGNRVGTNADGVSDALERNVVAGNGNGVTIYGEDSTGNTVAGNYIGIDAYGTPRGNTNRGVYVNSGSANLIGGALAAQGNTIAGNEWEGVYITGGTADNNVVQGNTVRDNGGDGVSVGSGTGNRVVANSIGGNGGLGIDLLPADGANANDAGDADTGGNDLQNHPVLTSALLTTSTYVWGSLDGQPSTDYTLQFFASAACDASGYGEGATYLGEKAVQGNATGTISFSAAVAAALVGQYVTATATDGLGNTSEFSACAAVVQPIAPANVWVSGPARRSPGVVATFQATVDPSGSSWPITFTWTADGQTTVVHEVYAAGDSVDFAWNDGGAKVVQVTATNAGGSAVGSAGIDVHANEAPTAADSAIYAAPGVASSGYLQGSDTNGDALTYAIASAPAQGTAVVTDGSTGAYSYTAGAGASGSDSFVYRVSDGEAEATATVSVTITADQVQYTVDVPLVNG